MTAYDAWSWRIWFANTNARKRCVTTSVCGVQDCRPCSSKSDRPSQQHFSWNRWLARILRCGQSGTRFEGEKERLILLHRNGAARRKKWSPVKTMIVRLINDTKISAAKKSSALHMCFVARSIGNLISLCRTHLSIHFCVKRFISRALFYSTLTDNSRREHECVPMYSTYILSEKHPGNVF